MSNYGIKVSKDGYDVKTCADIYLCLKSSIILQKVKLMGSTTVANNTTGSIAHGLAYVPQFLVYGEDPSNVANMNIGNASYVYSKLKAWADATYVYWRINTAVVSNFNIYYYVFYDPF